MVDIEVDELAEYDTSNIDPLRFLKFGKYKGWLIDELVKKDYRYCCWLAVYSAEKRMNRAYFDDFDRFILSDEYNKMLQAQEDILTDNF